MTQRHRVAVLETHRGTPRDERARRDVAAVVEPEGGTVTEPDEFGIFEVELGTETWEQALLKVIDAVAAAGGDDHLLIAEHPDVPEHWRLLRHAEGEP